MAEPRGGVLAAIRAELAAPVPGALASLAEAARARHGDALLAVLFYGSCLRDGVGDERIVDLYLLVSRYRDAHRGVAAAALNALLPPNVTYLECRHAGAPVRAKCAVVTLGQFARAVSPARREPYFWARFAQPARLAWARDAEVAERVAAALAAAVTTTWSAALPLLPPGADPLAVWSRVLAESYRTELRAEPPDRAARLVAADAARYRRLAGLLVEAGVAPETRTTMRARLLWRRRRLAGKALSLLRLAKAAFTFAGGADYLAWKIARHSGVAVALSPWQRRHPLLAAPGLFVRLWRRRAFR